MKIAELVAKMNRYEETTRTINRLLQERLAARIVGDEELAWWIKQELAVWRRAIGGPLAITLLKESPVKTAHRMLKFTGVIP